MKQEPKVTKAGHLGKAQLLFSKEPELFPGKMVQNSESRLLHYLALTLPHQHPWSSGLTQGSSGMSSGKDSLPASASTCHIPGTRLLTVAQGSKVDSRLGHFGQEHAFPTFLPEFSFAWFQLLILI